MKKILFMLILFIPFFVYAEYDESKITIESFNMSYKEGYGREISAPIINGKDINLSLDILNVGDKVVYDMVVKNESGEDVELYNRFENSDHIDYLLISPDLDYVILNGKSKTFQLEVEYVNQVSESNLTDGSLNESFTYSLEVSDEIGNPDYVRAIEDYPDTVDNPATKVVIKYILVIVCIIFVISIGLFLIIRRNKIGKLFIFIGCIGILTPIIVYAYKKISLKVNVNVVINEPFIVYPEDKNQETTEEGDIVKIGDEEFYVIGREGDDLVLLAKYNLLVGTHNDSTGTGTMTNGKKGYGLQNSMAVGAISDTQYTGTLPFSSTNYWNNNSNYEGSYEDPNYPYVYDINSTLFQYVDYYKYYLESLGAYIKEARLLKYSEAIELGCDDEETNCNNAPDYLKNTNFWLGSAKYPMLVWFINRQGEFNADANVTNTTYGIRPVIVLGTKKQEIDTTKPSYVCRKATELHTATCNRSDGNGCAKIGKGSTISFGSLVNGNPKAGDAYDCDVNNDKIFDPVTERFYYIKDDGDNVVLIHSRNKLNFPSYDEGNENWHGPRLAYQYLPSTSEWSNPGLIPPGTRNIVNENGENTTNNGANTIESFTYTNRAARLLTKQEADLVCNGSFDNCIYLLDNLDLYLYPSSDFLGEASYWLETPVSTYDRRIYFIAGPGGFSYNYCYYTYTVYCDYGAGIRPVITIKKSDLEK